MPLVELPSGQSVEFPDGVSADQMDGALRRDFPQFFQKLQPGDLRDETFRAVPDLQATTRGGGPARTGDLAETLAEPAALLSETVGRFPANVGRALGFAGNVSRAAVADIAANRAGAEFAGNVPAAFTGEPLPIDQALADAADEQAQRGEWGAATVLARTSQGLAKLAPKLVAAGVTGGGTLLGQSLAAGGLFGLDDEGRFHPKEAAFAALFPAAGAAGRTLAAGALTKLALGGSKIAANPTAQKAVELAADNAAQFAYATAVQSPELVQLSQRDPQAFKQSLGELVAMQLGFSLLGLRHLRGDVPSATQRWIEDRGQEIAVKLATDQAYADAVDARVTEAMNPSTAAESGARAAARPGVPPAPEEVLPKGGVDRGQETQRETLLTSNSDQTESPAPARQSDVARSAEAEAAGAETSPIPEQPATLAAQMERLTGGQRSVVLVTPGETMPEIPGRFKTHTVPGREDLGTFIYNPAGTSPGHINSAVSSDTLGRLLGYGIDAKPKPGTELGVVTVRKEDGTEVQAVVTDAKNLPSVAEAAAKVAGPTDTVQLESAPQVIAGRKAVPPTKPKKLTKKQEREQFETEAKAVEESASAAPDLNAWTRDRVARLMESGDIEKQASGGYLGRTLVGRSFIDGVNRARTMQVMNRGMAAGAKLQEAAQAKLSKAAEAPAAVAAKVEQHVEGVASGEKAVDLTAREDARPTTGPRPAKEIKTELVQRLDDQIAKLGEPPELLYTDPKKSQGKREFYIYAPDKSQRLRIRESTGAAWTIETEITNGKTGATERKVIGSASGDVRAATRAGESAMQKLLAGNPKPVTIQIPGDGKFTIDKTHAALEEVKRRAESITVKGNSSAQPFRVNHEPGIKQQADAAIQIYGTADRAVEKLKLQLDRAKELELTPEQSDAIENVIKELKVRAAAARPVNQIWQDQLAAQLAKVARDVKEGRTGLTPAQDVVRTAQMLEIPRTDLLAQLQQQGMTGRNSEFATKSYQSGTAGLGFPAAPTVAPTPAPAPAPGVTMIQHGRLPVTLDRTAPGSVSVPQIMDAMHQVLRTAGSLAGNLRTGRFLQQALGIWKPHEEIIRLEAADSIPTATHEVGHGLQQMIYGSAYAKGLKFFGPDIRRELIGMGKALYGSRKPAAGYTGEGFAEFARYWLTTDDAAKVAPKLTAFFEKTFLPSHPEVAKALTDARDLVSIWRAQGSVERAQRQVMRDPGAGRKTITALAKLVGYQAQFESGAPIEAITKAAARKLGRALAPSEDPFKLYSWKRGSAGATVERMATRHMLDVWGNPVGPSLAEALAPVKGQRNEFLLYLFGKAAEMRWAQGKNPGLSLEDAAHLVKLYDSPAFQVAADKYRKWNDQLLDYVVQADPAMADVVQKMRGANDFYAPLARMIDPAKVKQAAAGTGSNSFMRMHGSGLPVKDIFDQTFINAARLVNRANRALVTNSIIKLARIPGLGHIVEEVPRDRVAERFSVEQIRKQLETMGVDTTMIPQDEMLQYYSLADTPKGSDPVVAHRDATGRTRWYQVDPRLYDTLEGLQTYSLKQSFPGIPYLGHVLDLVLGAPARAFRLGTTGLRPAFSLVTNPARDLATLLAQTSSNPAKVAALYPLALAEAIKGGPYKDAFHDLGAHLGQPLGTDIGHTQRVSKELFHGRVMKVVRNPVDHLRELLGITESAPRIAELRAVADDLGWTPGQPLTPDQAVQLALAAKRVTVDFSAAGDVSRILNQAVPFYNPGLQGMRSFARAFQKNPWKASLVGLSLFTGPALALWWANKDKDWYRALPWRERYLYNHLDDGRHVWQIPRPFEWGNAFQVIPEAIFDSFYRHDPEAARQALGHVFETSNPLDYPVIAKLAKEQWQNKIDFWDRPIVPRSEVDLPAREQVGPYTSRLARAINQAFPDVSPRRVDAAVRGYFGGVGTDVMQLLGLGAERQDRQWEASDFPVFGVLARRGGQFNAQNQHINDFWDAYLPSKARVEGYHYATRQVEKGLRDQESVPTLASTDMAINATGENAAPAIKMLLLLANRTKDTTARAKLYQEAGQIAAEATASMRTSQKQSERPDGANFTRPTR